MSLLHLFLELTSPAIAGEGYDEDQDTFFFVDGILKSMARVLRIF
jgi:hypothetical protein